MANPESGSNETQSGSQILHYRMVQWRLLLLLWWRRWHQEAVSIRLHSIASVPVISILIVIAIAIFIFLVVIDHLLKQ
jgi:hypothetical protein